MPVLINRPTAIKNSFKLRTRKKKKKKEKEKEEKRKITFKTDIVRRGICLLSTYFLKTSK